MLLADLKKDKLKATKARDVERKNAITMVLGEVPRLNKKKGEQVTDEEVYSIINKLIKSELMILEASGADPDKSDYLSILRSYLPKMMSEDEIEAWVLANIDITSYHPPIKAMGAIMKELKGKADGNAVKKVLTRSK